jgi:hypothetical protein
MPSIERIHGSRHIHAGYATLRTSDTLFVNASLQGEDGSLGRKPVVVDFRVE